MRFFFEGGGEEESATIHETVLKQKLFTSSLHGRFHLLLRRDFLDQKVTDAGYAVRSVMEKPSIFPCRQSLDTS